MDELKAAVDKLGEGFTTFKDGFSNRLDNIEKVLGRPSSGNGDPAPDRKDAPMIFKDQSGKLHKALSNKHSVRESLDLSGEPEFERGAFGRVVCSMVTGKRNGLDDLERKALGEGTGSAGGWLVPAGMSPEIFDLARNQARCVQAGARTVMMDSPEMALIGVLTDPTAYWGAEHSEITESAGSFVRILLKAVRLGVLVRVSQELIQDATNAAQVIENGMTQALGMELDRCGLLGNGSNEPLGLDNLDGVNEYLMGTNGATLSSYDPFSYAVQYVAEDNGEATAVIMAPRTAYTLDRLKEATTNAPLAPPESFKALLKLATNQVPVNQTQGTATNASPSFVGDFRNMVFGMRSEVMIELAKAGTGSTGNEAFSRNEVLIRGVLRADVAFLRQNHFTVIRGIKV